MAEEERERERELERKRVGGRSEARRTWSDLEW